VTNLWPSLEVAVTWPLMAGAMLKAFICPCSPACGRLMRSYRQKSLNLETSYHTRPTKLAPEQ
jgi:hypothetical protein